MHLKSFELYDSNPQQLRHLKTQTQTDFEQALHFYAEAKLIYAHPIFTEIIHKNPQDKAARWYMERCEKVWCAGGLGRRGNVAREIRINR
ncbi:MAG: hypothetical protein DRR19_03035 [Candidatus Parabeggiatoa sp. nov. 1]|nr:MAG: hypothetical protein DRR19_03035 [Gammaproteobacteria bacterium]